MCISKPMNSILISWLQARSFSVESEYGFSSLCILGLVAVKNWEFSPGRPPGFFRDLPDGPLDYSCDMAAPPSTLHLTWPPHQSPPPVLRHWEPTWSLVHLALCLASSKQSHGNVIKYYFGKAGTVYFYSPVYLSVSLPGLCWGIPGWKPWVTQLRLQLILQKATSSFPYTQMQSRVDQSSDPTLLFTT